MNQDWSLRKKSFFQMVQFTEVKSETARGTDMVFKSGLMVPSMRDNGKMIRLTEEESFITLMETYMMVSLDFKLYLRYRLLNLISK